MPWLTSRWNGSGMGTWPRSNSTLCQKRAVEQVQHGMLRPADVEIDRQPVLRLCRIAERLVVVRIDVAQVVPARAGPLRHGVGLAAVALAVARDLDPVRRLAQRRLGLAASACSPPVRAGAAAARRASAARRRPVGLPSLVQFVQDRERLAPVALPAEEPVAQLVVDLALAQPVLFQPGGDLLLELGRRQAVEGPELMATPSSV